MKMTAKDVKEITYMPLVTFFSVLERPGKNATPPPPPVRRGLIKNASLAEKPIDLTQPWFINDNGVYLPCYVDACWYICMFSMFNVLFHVGILLNFRNH